MIADFSRTLSFLRQEKGISQRQAAQELGVSQALLSHYENGVREPGFSFLLKVCEYYRVSADFILGRTLSREGRLHPDAEALLSSSSAREITLDEVDLADLSYRTLSHASELLFSLLAQTKDADAIRAAFDYVSTAVYTLFRCLYHVDGRHSTDLFSVSPEKYSLGVAKVDMLSSEITYGEALLRHSRKKGHFPDLSDQSLQRIYGEDYNALLHIIHLTGQRIRRQWEDKPS